MASMERKHEICSPFVPQRNTLRKTSAEIVSEARHSLRIQSTQRPFTPRDGQRQLFGKRSARTDCDNRPPSTFRFVTNSTTRGSEINYLSHVTCRNNEPFSLYSLHSQNFDAPDSRPGSGTRLSPLDHVSPLTCTSVYDI